MMCIDCGIRPKRKCGTGIDSYCNHCCNVRKQNNRMTRWNSGERPECKNHPGRTVRKKAWVIARNRLCAHCWARYTPSARKQIKRRQSVQTLSGLDALRQRSKRLKKKLMETKI